MTEALSAKACRPMTKRLPWSTMPRIGWTAPLASILPVRSTPHTRLADISGGIRRFHWRRLSSISKRCLRTVPATHDLLTVIVCRTAWSRLKVSAIRRHPASAMSALRRTTSSITQSGLRSRRVGRAAGTKRRPEWRRGGRCGRTRDASQSQIARSRRSRTEIVPPPLAELRDTGRHMIPGDRKRPAVAFGPCANDESARHPARRVRAKTSSIVAPESGLVSNSARR